MSERNDKPLESPEEGAQQATPASNQDAFQRAEDRLAAGNEDRSARAREALAGIENRPAEDRASKAEDASTRRSTRDERREGDDSERAADDKLDDALDEKAREEGVTAADDSARIETDLTPHNI